MLQNKQLLSYINFNSVNFFLLHTEYVWDYYIIGNVQKENSVTGLHKHEKNLKHTVHSSPVHV